MNEFIIKEYNSPIANSFTVNKCLNIYENFNKSFGFLLLVMFSCSSFLIIVHVFFVISDVLYGVTNEKIPETVGLSLYAMCL